MPSVQKQDAIVLSAIQSESHTLTTGERALRQTQIRSVHEVGELRRAQEMRSDDFSRNEWREKSTYCT